MNFYKSNADAVPYAVLTESLNKKEIIKFSTEEGFHEVVSINTNFDIRERMFEDLKGNLEVKPLYKILSLNHLEEITEENKDKLKYKLDGLSGYLMVDTKLNKNQSISFLIGNKRVLVKINNITKTDNKKIFELETTKIAYKEITTYFSVFRNVGDKVELVNMFEDWGDALGDVMKRRSNKEKAFL